MSFTAHVASQFTTYETDRKMQSQDAVYTTSNGMPMPHPYESQRVGESGPLLLLQDFHLIDLLSHSDRERIPERVVHAKGSGAHGFFFVHRPHPRAAAGRPLRHQGEEVPRHGALLDGRW